MGYELEIEYVNQTKGYRFGGERYPLEEGKTRRELFRDLQREYGRCVSPVMITLDLPDGSERNVAVGWVFQKRMEYEDSHRYGRRPCRSVEEHRANCTYLRETWVSFIHTKPEETYYVERDQAFNGNHHQAGRNDHD